MSSAVDPLPALYRPSSDDMDNRTARSMRFAELEEGRTVRLGRPVTSCQVGEAADVLRHGEIILLAPVDEMREKRHGKSSVLGPCEETSPKLSIEVIVNSVLRRECEPSWPIHLKDIALPFTFRVRKRVFTCNYVYHTCRLAHI